MMTNLVFLGALVRVGAWSNHHAEDVYLVQEVARERLRLVLYCPKDNPYWFDDWFWISTKTQLTIV